MTFLGIEERDNLKRRRLLELLLYFIIFSYITIMSMLTPLVIDDILFMNMYLENSGGSTNFSLKGILGFIEVMRKYDNSRISNMFAPICALVTPFKQLFPFFTGLCVCGCVRIISIWSNKSQSPFATFLIWMTILIFLPWRNNIFSQDYSLNYVFGSFITLLNIYFIVNHEKKGWKASNFCGIIILSIVAGGWHEGFAVPTIFGLFVCTIFNRFKRSPQWYAILATYFISAIAFGLSEGMINRAIIEQTTPIPLVYYKLIADLFVPIILFLCVMVGCVYKKGRKILKKIFCNDVVVIFFFTCIIASIISIKFDHTARTAFYPDLCAIIVVFVAFSQIGIKDYVTCERNRRWIKYLIGFLFSGIWLIQGASSIYWQHIFYEENKEIMKGISESKTGTFFYDITMPEEVPIYTLYFPSKSNWVTEMQLRSVRDYLSNDMASIVPTALRLARIENSRNIGNGFYENGGAIFTAINYNPTRKFVYFDLMLKDGRMLYNKPAFDSVYINEYGDKYHYYKIYNINSSEIQSLTINRLGR